MRLPHPFPFKRKLLTRASERSQTRNCLRRGTGGRNPGPFGTGQPWAYPGPSPIAKYGLMCSHISSVPVYRGTVTVDKRPSQDHLTPAVHLCVRGWSPNNQQPPRAWTRRRRTLFPLIGQTQGTQLRASTTCGRDDGNQPGPGERALGVLLHAPYARAGTRRSARCRMPTQWCHRASAWVRSTTNLVPGLRTERPARRSPTHEGQVNSPIFDNDRDIASALASVQPGWGRITQGI